VLIDNFAVVGALDVRHRRWVRDGVTVLVYVSHNHEQAIREQLAANAPRRSLKRFALRWDAIKTASVERALVDAADLVTVNAYEDAELYRRHAPNQRYVVLTPGYDGPRVEARTIEAQTPRRITLLGSYAWIAKQLNLWRFLDAGIAQLTRAGIGIDVVGWTPDDFADRLRRSFPDVVVTGPVDRVEPYLARSRMGIVAEEIGGGFKHKVLHYVFNRLPVASLAGSVAGTPLMSGESILEFPDITRLVEGVIVAIDDLARLNALQEAAFRACQGRFAWADRGRALADTLTALRSDRTGWEA
jgi:glycosyltransferase involved in cell wall biosynthesis